MTAALPTGLKYGTVRWTVVGAAEDSNDPGSNPDPEMINGTVTFRPVVDNGIKFIGTSEEPEPITILPRKYTYSIVSGVLKDSSGSRDVRLVACDSPATSPQEWQYLAEYQLDDGYTFGSFRFKLHTEETVYLTLKTPETAADGVAYVTGPPGAAGGPGEGYGGGFLVAPVDLADPLELSIISKWGIDAGGGAYYNENGAIAGEAALVMPDPYSGRFFLFKPGAGAEIPESLRSALETDAFGAQVITLESPTDRMADSARLRIISSQKQEPENNLKGGETVWLDLADPLAKQMLTWRIRYNLSTGIPYAPDAVPAEADWESVVWSGAHYYAQDQVDDENPTDVHGHWSVETPDTGHALRTRLEVPFVDQDTGVIGVDIANIQTNKSDFTVRTDTGGVLRVGGPASTGPRDLVFASSNRRDPTKRRWIFRADAAQETGSNAGSNLQILAVSDAGVEATPSLTFERKTGRIGIGRLVSTTDTPQMPQATLDIRNVDGATNAPTLRVDGIAGQSASAVTINMVAATDRAMAYRLITDSQTRLAILGSGQMEWGDGAASRDTNLYRLAANILRTDDKFLAVGGVGVGNSAVATTLGTVTRRMQVFDATGAGIGYVPIYDNIT